MYLNDRSSFAETITGATHDTLHDETVSACADAHGEHGLTLTFSFGSGATAALSVALTAPNPLMAHDVLLEAATIGSATFVGMRYQDVLEYAFPDSDFVSEVDNNNAA
jgi:hypothetical protein